MVVPEGVVGLDVVHLVIPGDEADRGPAISVDEGEGLAGGGLTDVQQGRHVGDAARSGGVNLLQLADRPFPDRCHSRRRLSIRRKSARLAVDELRLAGIGKRHELDRAVAADLARVGGDGKRTQAAALADPGVGGLLLLVALLQGLLGRAERVGILHDELSPTHEPEAGPQLVAELILDLVERDRELPVALELAANEVGEGLLVGGTERKAAVVAIGEAHELGPVVVPAAALLPELAIGEDGDLHLLGADGLHLVTDDVLYLPDGPPGKWEVAVEARGLPAYHACAKQQPVTRQLGLRRILLECGGVEPRHPHVASHCASFHVGPMAQRSLAVWDAMGRYQSCDRPAWSCPQTSARSPP